ncbi:hypothetical protein CEB94_00470 [Streptomyces hawaiiensis]|uniref:Uncharacterized protein n=1 Tax=Streptomyces hawaiiensis TaxID=67305 RepID=A0A6G5R7D5_9ACTN|nr:hypothetical protein CEB94_00470 [Streptomyces hawaiiensis]
MRCPGRQAVALHRVSEAHRIAGPTRDLPGEEEPLRVLWLSMQCGGFTEVVFDEAGQFRWEYHRVPVDRQVSVLVFSAGAAGR